MEVVNDSKVTSTGDWNVKSLDVSSLKMNIDDDKMDVIIASPNLTCKDYKLTLNDGQLSIILVDTKNTKFTYKAEFLLPYSDFSIISSDTFVKGQLKISLKKNSKKTRSRKMNYNEVA
ncbi:hypothetical protein [Aquimarina agarivorans]|uniref:hypothetical protein n=1 Tax=Aquimarina agarivorans TaxID=980584 RepID=UPI000248FAF0|nr:hypothetical protein [Aquimarina agarivorans]